MKKSFLAVLVTATAATAWMSVFGGPAETALSVGLLQERWKDMLDMDLVREYIREKLPVIRRIVEITYRSFGPNR